MKKTGLVRANEVLKLHTKGKQLPMLVASDVVEVLDDEKAAKKAAEICAKELKKVFKDMKKENPNENVFDVCKSEEGKKLIYDFLKMEKGKINKKRLFEYLSMKLGNQGLECNRPSYDYFTDSPFDDVWFKVWVKGTKKIEDFK